MLLGRVDYLPIFEAIVVVVQPEASISRIVADEKLKLVTKAKLSRLTLTFCFVDTIGIRRSLSKP